MSFSWRYSIKYVVIEQPHAYELVDCVVPDERVERYENTELRHEAGYFNSRHAADEVGDVGKRICSRTATSLAMRWSRCEDVTRSIHLTFITI